MAVNNATCSICGAPYYMCNSCKDFKLLYPYKLHTDTEEHYKIYQIIHGYSTGVYDKVEAKKKLQAVDLSDLNSFRDNIQTVIKEIIGANDIDDKSNDTMIETSEVVDMADTVKAIAIEDKNIIEIKTNNSNKSYGKKKKTI